MIFFLHLLLIDTCGRLPIFNAVYSNKIDGKNLLSGSGNPEAIALWLDSVPSPLEQFTIIPWIPIKIGQFFFSFTNSSFFMLATLAFVLLFLYFVTQNGGGKLVPNAWQSVVELIYD